MNINTLRLIFIHNFLHHKTCVANEVKETLELALGDMVLRQIHAILQDYKPHTPPDTNRLRIDFGY